MLLLTVVVQQGAVEPFQTALHIARVEFSIQNDAFND